MEITEHEEILNTILNTVTDGEQRSTIIDQLELLRADYGSTTETLENFEKENKKIKTENDALIVSNSKLFRERAITETTEETKEIDETVTLESLGL